MKKRVLIIALVAILLIALFAIIGAAKEGKLFPRHIVNMDTGEVSVIYEEAREADANQKPGPLAIELPVDVFE